MINLSSQHPITHINGIFQPISAGVISGSAAAALSHSDECIYWADKPTSALLAGLITIHVLVISGVAYATVSWSLESRYLLVALAIAALHFTLRLWKLQSTYYRLSSQRLEITSGMFNQATITHEVHQLGNMVILRPLLLRIIGRGNLLIRSGNGSDVFLNLQGIRQPDVVRDLIRRLGEIEAQRIDKIRWR